MSARNIKILASIFFASILLFLWTAIEGGVPAFLGLGLVLFVITLGIFKQDFSEDLSKMSKNKDSAGWANIDSLSPKNIERLKKLKFFGIDTEATEAKLFAIALVAILIPTIYGLWGGVFNALINVDQALPLLVLVNFGWGIYLSLFHAFVRRPKTKKELVVLRSFLVYTMILLALATAWHSSESEQVSFTILSVWSTLQAIVWLYLGNNDWAHLTIQVQERELTIKEIFAAIIVVTIVIMAMKEYGQHWIIAASTTLFVWSYIDSNINKYPNATQNL